MRSDLFSSLPRPTALLLMSSVFELTSAQFLHLPRQTPPPTTTLPNYAFNVVSWPLVATPAPWNPLDLLRRQDETNTVCGYIGGNSELPATCSAGSHCVVDKDLNVVGCCPNGAASCTAGVYTGCVDDNSGPQTAQNPLVFTCQGGQVCYKNVFDGGASQFGCGTASSMGTKVMSNPTSVTSTESSSSSSSSRSSSTTSSETSRNPQIAPTPSNRPGPPINTGSGDRIGPIVGGAIGGASVLIALIALLIFFLRRRRGNIRQGPGSKGSGMYISPPRSAAGSGFTPLHQSQDAFETGLPPPAPGGGGGPPGGPTAPTPAWATDTSGKGPSPFAYTGASGAHSSYPPSEGYHYPGQYPAAYANAGAPVLIPAGVAAYGGGKGKAPLITTTHDYSSGNPKGLGRIGEEDEDREKSGFAKGNPFTDDTSQGEGTGARNSEQGPSSPDSGTNTPTGRPLWQQNRRQSRNQVWV